MYINEDRNKDFIKFYKIINPNKKEILIELFYDFSKIIREYSEQNPILNLKYFQYIDKNIMTNVIIPIFQEFFEDPDIFHQDKHEYLRVRNFHYGSHLDKEYYMKLLPIFVNQYKENYIQIIDDDIISYVTSQEIIAEINEQNSINRRDYNLVINSKD